MWRMGIVCLAAAVLAACDSSPEELVAPSGARTMQAPSYGMFGPDDGAQADPAPDAPTGARLMAYTYAMTVELPSEAIPAALERDAEQCRAAGVALCEIISTDLVQRGDYSLATLALRADPEWLEGFRADVAQRTTDAEGRITRLSSDAVDLTRSIIDVETRLEAKRVLRERLTALLAREGASVGDLVEAERQLAEVQGEIESAEAQVRVLRLRVQTSELTIGYERRTNPAEERGFDTFFSMLDEVTEYLALGMGTLVVSLAFLAPWLLIVLPLLWLLLRAIGRARAKRKAAQAG